jgi:Xaa-Pro dipeptidase
MQDAARSKYVNIEGIRRTVDEGPYDAVIVMSPENVPYYSGFYNIDLRLLPERIHLVVWPKNDEPVFVVIDRRANSLRPGDTFLTEIASYEGEEYDSMRVVAEVLESKGLSSGRIGIEGRQFSSQHLRELQARVPDARFEDAFYFIESVRLIKTPSEVETLTKVNRWTTEAIDAAFDAASIGDSERSVSARMQYELLRRGADQITAPIFASGPRTGNFHPTASGESIDGGMLVKTDFGGSLDGYLSDIARTAVMGRATENQKRLHEKVSHVKDRIVDYIRPGMPASEVAMFGRKVYEELELEYRWAILGHGLGLGLHESPQIYPWVDTPIEAGMVMMIETGYNDFPNDSVHVEDLILVTEDGAHYLTDATRHEEIWELGSS